MQEKEVIYAGTSGKLNYKKLVKNKCNLAILSSSVLPKKGSTKKAAKKKMKAYQKMTEKMTLLEMPVIVDRSKDEKDVLAKYEWSKGYGALFGCEKEASKLYESAAGAHSSDSKESTDTQDSTETKENTDTE